MVIPNGVDVQPLAPEGAPEESPRVVFCGVMNYTPNVDGALWFCKSVWPAIRQRRPDAQLSLVGSDPVAAIRRLNAPENGIAVTGTVDDVRPYLWQSAVAVAPLLIARGVQNKVLEAVGAGLPTVVSPQVFDGLPRTVRAACRVGASAETFAAETTALLEMTGEQRRAMASAVDLKALSWESQLRPLVTLLASRDRSTGVA
jgi:glycosyltransferase involved in cell wall biosynthesis